MTWNMFRARKTEYYCELCGKETADPFYTALYSLDYLIFAKNEAVHHVDRENNVVVLKSGESLEFMFPFADYTMLGMPYRSNEHLLCSEACEDRIAAKMQVSFSQTYHLKALLCSFRKEGIQYVCVVPCTRLPAPKKTCIVCGREYPSYGRHWTEMRIRERKVIYGNVDNRVTYDNQKYCLLMSGLQSNGRKEGNQYLYDLDTDAPVERCLCSYDCAFAHAREQNVSVAVDSVLEKDRLGSITGDTEAINADLKCSIPHRPSFLRQL